MDSYLLIEWLLYSIFHGAMITFIIFLIYKHCKAEREEVRAEYFIFFCKADSQKECEFHNGA